MEREFHGSYGGENGLAKATGAVDGNGLADGLPGGRETLTPLAVGQFLGLPRFEDEREPGIAGVLEKVLGVEGEIEGGKQGVGKGGIRCSSEARLLEDASLHGRQVVAVKIREGGRNSGNGPAPLTNWSFYSSGHFERGGRRWRRYAIFGSVGFF